MHQIWLVLKIPKKEFFFSPPTLYCTLVEIMLVNCDNSIQATLSESLSLSLSILTSLPHSLPLSGPRARSRPRVHSLSLSLHPLLLPLSGRLNVWRLVSGHEDVMNDVAVSNDRSKVIMCSLDQQAQHSQAANILDPQCFRVNKQPNQT